MLIASFDIGTKNFAFCVEEFDTGLIPPCVISPKYTSDGTCSLAFQEYLNGAIFRNGRVRVLQNVNISGRDYQHVCVNMYNTLDTYRETLQQCSIVLIEKQMNRNTVACKLAQHCYSYFIYHAFKTRIVDFPASNKTRVLGAPKKMTKYQRKKWAVEKTTQIFKLRTEHQELLDTASKKDDMSDAFLQLQAYKCLTYTK